MTYTTSKTFEVVYTRYDETEDKTMSITLDTSGESSDWYPRLFSRLNAFVIRNDYTSSHYITSLKCYDADKSCYKNATSTKIQNCGMYFQYVHENKSVSGYWLSQHPDHAKCCHRMMDRNVDSICKDVSEGRRCDVPTRKGLDDVILGNLYPDNVQNLNSFIQGSNIPQRTEVLKTIEDCSNAFSWIQRQINENYLNVPNDWIEWSNNIQNRLACARTWVEHSTPQCI